MAMTLIPQFTAEFWGAVDEAATRLGVYAEDDDVATAADRIASAHNVDSTVAVTMIESQLSMMVATMDGTADYDDEARLDDLHRAITEEEDAMWPVRPRPLYRDGIGSGTEC